MITDDYEIKAFLNTIKKSIDFQFVPRDKNRESLDADGITYDYARETIKRLTFQDWVKGPEPDRDDRHGGDIWVFKANVYGKEYYIKLKYLEKFCVTKVISFHRSGR